MRGIVSTRCHLSNGRCTAGGNLLLNKFGPGSDLRFSSVLLPRNVLSTIKHLTMAPAKKNAHN